ncbi:hypothetical protein CHARACLAT_014044, partial [Characodon lateralis]|nr:hypothetical protein [Characodon lateralis]
LFGDGAHLWGLCPCEEEIHGIWVRRYVFDICVLVVGGPVRKFMLGFLGGAGLMRLRSKFIGRLGLSGPGSLRHQHRLAQPRFRCWGDLPVSTPGGMGTTSWVRGLFAPMGYQHLDLGVWSMYGECE